VRARFSVAIRTAVVDTASGAAVYGTGGGITWSSEAAAEHAEVLAKAAVLSCRPEEFELLETSRREPYDRRRRRPDVDDVVLVNERGEVTEATTATPAVRLDGRWWTPPQDSGCLPGVERARVLDLGQLGERVLTVADLLAAEEVAVLSSLRGWRSATLVDAGADPAAGAGVGRLRSGS